MEETLEFFETLQPRPHMRSAFRGGAQAGNNFAVSGAHRYKLMQQILVLVSDVTLAIFEVHLWVNMVDTNPKRKSPVVVLPSDHQYSKYELRDPLSKDMLHPRAVDMKPAKSA